MTPAERALLIATASGIETLLKSEWAKIPASTSTSASEQSWKDRFISDAVAIQVALRKMEE